MMKQYFTITGISEISGLSRVRIYQLLDEGRIPQPDAMTSEGHKLWSDKVVEKWLKNRIANPPKPGRPRKVSQDV